MKPWSTQGVEGIFRFLNRVWRLFITEEGSMNPLITSSAPPEEFARLYHQTVKKIGEDIETLRFNTAISQLMIFVNEAMKLKELPRDMLEGFVVILSPFAPHQTEELWSFLGKTGSIFTTARWPEYDSAKLLADSVTVVAQVNGKIRAKFDAPLDASEELLKRMAREEPNMKTHLSGKTILKEIVVKNKLVNIVAK